MEQNTTNKIPDYFGIALQSLWITKAEFLDASPKMKVFVKIMTQLEASLGAEMSKLPRTKRRKRRLRRFKTGINYLIKQ